MHDSPDYLVDLPILARTTPDVACAQQFFFIAVTL